MSIDGTEETQLTQTTEASDPAKIAAAAANTRDTERDLQLFVQNIQGRWSPDGRWIVYASNEGRDSKGRRNFDIWLMAADGSARTQLTTNGSWDDSPCWDRAGELVYFRSNRGAAWNIWRLKPILENQQQALVN
jgi:Tol biopolymer transport system component